MTAAATLFRASTAEADVRARAQAQARSRALLARVLPFERWVASLTEARKAALIAAEGSLENAYWPLVHALEREAADPSPRWLRQTTDGIEVGWAADEDD